MKLAMNLEEIKNDEATRILVERIHKIIGEEMSGLELSGPMLMNSLIEEMIIDTL